MPREPIAYDPANRPDVEVQWEGAWCPGEVAHGQVAGRRREQGDSHRGDCGQAPLFAPGQWSHAAHAGADATLCRKSVTELKDFSKQPFRHVNPILRCKECDDAAGNPSS